LQVLAIKSDLVLHDIFYNIFNFTVFDLHPNLVRSSFYGTFSGITFHLPVKFTREPPPAEDKGGKKKKGKKGKSDLTAASTASTTSTTSASTTTSATTASFRSEVQKERLTFLSLLLYRLFSFIRPYIV
jgi:hypothetical protein